ncbi:hypothetical protein B0T25DRAFT_514730 [Lasiosphaeria hispida]|uniref:Uncharacterized protein n=1 Tax=Lasiosphaeria hispida TaxID=260671 RepID=A0AAJ0HPU2_9PEZI|nr:hypothetical protein B0T25DRAFT_514730 [Lasiosphaeria hispida]
MADVIGLIGDGIGILSFIASIFPNRGTSNACTVRIAAALNGNGLSGGDGSVAQVRLYNENQQIIGNAPGGYASSGGFKDITVSQTNTQQSTFIQLAASNDAICIPYASTTWVDGGKYGWVGDWGYKCGLQWYWGNVYVDNGKNKPRCTWIDADHTNGIPPGMLFIHWPSFAGNQGHSDNPSSYCGWPAFRAYKDPNGGGVIVKKDNGDSGETKVIKRALDSRLVVSSEPSHNATELCASETSRGPDFVSLAEGVYCNMETSETLPLCGGALQAACFQLESNGHVKRDGNSTQKPYTEVIKWE